MKTIKEALEKTKKLLKSKEMLCACYAYDNEKNKNEESFRKFLTLWENLQDNEKDKVVTIFFNLNNREMYYTLCVEQNEIKRSGAYEKIRFHYLERSHKGIEIETMPNVFRKK